MPEFVHLHCHTEYSLLDGAIRLSDLCDTAKDFGMPAVAITDHGNMYGAINFYLQAQKTGIKPILGCEVYVAGADLDDRTSPLAKARYHLVLLAKDLAGYHNLVKLVTFGHLKGFYHKPRITKEMLAQHNEGLFALSACLAGEVPRKLMGQGFQAGLAAAEEYAKIFPDRFYLELQSNGLKEQDALNEQLIELAAKSSLPMVATNDCHYLRADDVNAHDILLCIQTAACVDDEKRMRFETKELYYKSPEEMEAAFSHVPEAIANTALIAEQCNVELDLKTYHFPNYELADGRTPEEEFADMSRKGLDARLEKLPYRDTIDEQAYRDRLEYEIGVINSMGFAAYFLIVQDFINWAKNMNIPVGPGRGSAAGSLVAWALKITNLDPIPYNLLFERFLNNERVSMPDIDVDFCERKRIKVINYVSEKYGADSVAQITTFGKMKAKAVVRDVGRALGMSFGETDKIAKLIPEDFKMTIDKALSMNQDLDELYKSDQRITQLIDVSRRLEGLSRHSSTHAAGVVIGDKPLNEYLPLYKGKKDEIVTQFDMKMVEKVGLIKFDFLGLKTMTVIQDALDFIEHRGQEPPDLDTLSLDDPATYELYCKGDTDGVFQVESDGMRRYLRQLKPSCFDDIIAMLALYRPGPLGSGMVDEFIKRKHGEVEVTYPLPQLEDTLKATYGVIVYQEQVMRIAQVVAKYTLGGADLLRRAMGKKNPEAMAEQRATFVQGAKENNITADKANEIFDLMEKFAEYGFNKSHSAAYALISYYTAYLKTHHPAEFMAALLTSELSDQDKLLKHITACRDMGIDVLPPDVSVSYRNFTVPADKESTIVFGLGGVKNVGDEAIREIVEARESEDGPFASLLDLCSRVNLRKVTKRVLESLIKSGAMDCLGCSRKGMFAALDDVVARGQKAAKDKNSGQVSLFSMVEHTPEVCPGIGYSCTEQEMEEWEDDQKLKMEKEALGFYLSSHPLLAFREAMKRLELFSLEQCAEMGPQTEIKTAVMITGVKEHFTRKGDKMAFCSVDDLTGSGEATMFPEVYAQARPHMEIDQPLLITGKISDHDGFQQEDGLKQAKLLVDTVASLAEAAVESEAPVLLDIEAARLENGGLDDFKRLLNQFPGRIPVQVRLRLPDTSCLLQLGPDHTIMPGPDFDKAFQKWNRLSETTHA